MYAFIYIFYNLSIPILDCLLQHCAALVSQKQAEPSSSAIGGTRRRLCMLKGGRANRERGDGRSPVNPLTSLQS